MTSELGHREVASFVALSVGLHLIALFAPRADRVLPPLPETPVLVFEMVESAPVAAAPAVPEPPPPVEKQPLPSPPPPEPVARTAPKLKPPPKVVPVVRAAAAPKAAPSPSPAPAPVVKPPPVARAATTAPAARARYEDLLYTWLVRHKEYPLVASRRGIEGRPVLTVRIDRQGRVMASRISTPSRYAILDEAAVAMVRRASPFPPVPENVAGDSYEFIAPVEFRLR